MKRPAKYYSGLSGWQQYSLFIIGGVILGIVVFLIRISNAASYALDAPETCINCHVMNDAYASWQRGSHGQAAVCNDCHVPQSNFAAKYAFKAKDGMKHSYVFTLRKEPQVLKLSSGAVGVIQENCLVCHNNQFAMIRLADVSERTCWECHTNIHSRVHSLSASGDALRPRLNDAGLDWMKKGFENE